MPPAEAIRPQPPPKPPPPPPKPQPKAETAAPAQAQQAPKPQPRPQAPAARKDTFEAASPSRDAQQKKLSGGEQAATPAQAAENDARRIRSAKTPEAQAKMLETYTQKGGNSDYQKKLFEASGPEIKGLAQTVTNEDVDGEQRKAIYDSLSSAGEKAGPENSKVLAEKFASGLPNEVVGDDGDQLGGFIKSGITDGKGATFGTELASALNRTGKPEAANDAAKFVHEGIDDLKNDFAEKQSAVNDVNQRLGQFVRANKENLSQEDLKKFVDGYKAEYQEEIDAFEDAGSKLSSTLQGAGAALKEFPSNVCVPGAGDGIKDLQTSAQDAMKAVPALAETKAGRSAVAQTVADQGAGRESWLDQATKLGSAGNEAFKQYKGQLGTTVLKSIGAQAIDDAKSGKLDVTNPQYLKGLRQDAALFGASQDQMDKIVRDLGDFKASKTESQLKASTYLLNKDVDGLEAGKSAAFRGLGTVLGLASAYQGVKDFGSADLQGKLSTIAGGLDTTTGAAAFTLDVLGKGGAAEFAAKAGGVAGGALGAVVSTMGAVNDFKNGDIAGGVTNSAAALGGTMMALSPLFGPAAPGVAAVGGALAVGATAVNLAIEVFSGENPVSRGEDALENAYQAAGLDEDVAATLAQDTYGQDVGPFLTQTARYMGVDPKDLFKDLNGLNGTELNSLLLTLHGRESISGYDKNQNPQFTGQSLLGGAGVFLRSGAVPEYQQHPVYDPVLKGIRVPGDLFRDTTPADFKRLQDTDHKLVWDPKTQSAWQDGEYFPTLTEADVARRRSGVELPG